MRHSSQENSGTMYIRLLKSINPVSPNNGKFQLD